MASSGAKCLPQLWGLALPRPAQLLGGPTETISPRALLAMDVDGAAVGARRVSLCHQTLQVAAPARSGDGSLEYKELSVELFTETEDEATSTVSPTLLRFY